MKSLKGKLGRVLLPIFLATTLVAIPLISIGAIWVQNVGLLPDTAIVFSNDAPAVDRMMAAALKSVYGDRIGICDGVNDDVEIQAAVDAVRSVKLSTGTFYCEVTVDIDNSDQALRGYGWNSILTTSTAQLVFLSAVGGAGTELTGLTIADLQIDGGAGAISDCGIYWEYVDYSSIENVYSRRHASGAAFSDGIYLLTSDFNSITDNICEANDYTGIGIDTSVGNTITDNKCLGNGFDGICLWDSSDTAVADNLCQGNVDDGIYSDTSSYNDITGNVCLENGMGIILGDSDANNVNDNVCRLNLYAGIDLSGSDSNAVVGNTLTQNSQGTTNTDPDIVLDGCDYNLIEANVCRSGGLAKVPSYGIEISAADCDDNLVIDNDLSGGGWGTAPFYDAGTGTKLNVFVAPFVDGSDPQDSGFLIDANLEYARSYLRLPGKVVQVVGMIIYARSVVAEADKMRGEFVIYGAADNENYQTHTGSIVNHPSTSSNFAADDVIYWTITTAGVLALQGGDSIEVKVLHEAAGNGDCATNAYIRTVEIEYVS